MGSTTFKWALNLVHMGLRSSALVMCAVRTHYEPSFFGARDVRCTYTIFCAPLFENPGSAPGLD